MKEILSIIYSLYPRNLKYDTQEYQNSTQHLNFKLIIANNCTPEEHRNKYSIIKTVFNEHFVEDFSSDDYWSYEFIVLATKVDDVLDNDFELLKKLNGTRKDILIYISKISNFYYYTFSTTKLVGNMLRFEYEDLSPVFKEELSELNCYMESQNYSLLSTEQISKVIPDIETECVEMGHARVFDLLFTDLYSNAPYRKDVSAFYNSSST